MSLRTYQSSLFSLQFHFVGCDAAYESGSDEVGVPNSVLFVRMALGEARRQGLRGFFPGFPVY